MTVRRLVAIAFILFGASVAWAMLGSSLLARTGSFDGRLEPQVQLLWGGPHRQVAPSVWILRPGTETETVETKEPDGRIVRSASHEAGDAPDPGAAGSDARHRHARSRASAQGAALVSHLHASRSTPTIASRNPDAEARTMPVRFPLPAENALFDDFVFQLDGRQIDAAGDIAKEMSAAVTAAAGATGDARRPVPVARHAHLDVCVRRKRRRAGARLRAGHAHQLSPTSTSRRARCRRARARRPITATNLSWSFANLISGQAIGMELPERLNPGPFAARVTFFAPVSLLFFLTVMVMVGATSGPALHPMHYWFIACGLLLVPPAARLPRRSRQRARWRLPRPPLISLDAGHQATSASSPAPAGR